MREILPTIVPDGENSSPNVLFRTGGTKSKGDELLAGELLVLDTGGRTLKRPAGVQLSHQSVNVDVDSVGVLWRPSGSTFWQSTECSPAGDSDLVNFNAPGEGVYAVITYPRSEHFELPVRGCLFSARLHRQISIRCPKGSVSSDIHCDVQIIPLKARSLQSPIAQADIAAATDFFRFIPSANVEFKRALTVKLPLPVSRDDDHVINGDDVAVCQTVTSQDGGDWTVVEGAVKLSKNSVSFDTKSLTKFCVVLVKPAGGARTVVPRGSRLTDTIRRVELDTESPRGDILPFLQLADKRWTLCVECVRLDQVQKSIEEKGDMRLLKPSVLQAPVVGTGRSSETRQRPSWRRTSTNGPEVPRVIEPDVELRLHKGSVLRLELSGDLEVVPDNSEDSGEAGAQQRKMTYHPLVSRCCREFTLAPKSAIVTDDSVPKVLTGILKVYKTNVDGSVNEFIRCYDFDVPPEVVATYLYVPPPTPEVETPAAPVSPLSALLLGTSEAETESAAAAPTSAAAAPAPGPTRRDPREIAETINRLTKPIRPPAIVPKEPRVLSGRSLQCLARQLPGTGISLAIQLEISESCITGMAFDALASGCSTADITYRILLLWKRRLPHYPRHSTPDAVDWLVSAVAGTGNRQVADVIVEYHRVNRELTPDCFAAAGDCPVTTPQSLTNGHAEVPA